MAQGPDEIGGERRVNVQPNESTARSSAPTTDELRTQIEATRTEMGDTIGAIQDRLRPGRLMADVKDVVKEATVGRVKSLTHKASARAGEFGDWSTTPASALQKMKDHPVPMALVGAAATGLFVGALRRRRAIDPAAGYVTHKRGATSNRGIRSAARFMAIAGAARVLGDMESTSASRRRHSFRNGHSHHSSRDAARQSSLGKVLARCYNAPPGLSRRSGGGKADSVVCAPRAVIWQRTSLLSSTIPPKLHGAARHRRELHARNPASAARR